MDQHENLDGIGWVLWSATIGLESPIAARVDAARAAGFTRFSLSATDVARLAEQGTDPEELGRQLRDSGLEELLQAVIKLLPEGPQYFPPETYTDQPERFLASEIIREDLSRR